MFGKLDELTLIARCVAGDDRRAFAQLVNRYESPLRQFLLGLTGGDECLTADLAQETFIKAWRNMRSWRGIAGFKTWLYAIAVNEFRSYVRSQRPYTDEMPDLPTDSVDVAVDATIDLQTALRRLSDAQREVVLLFYCEDMPLKRISAITGMPEGTVKSHLSRARAILTKILK